MVNLVCFGKFISQHFITQSDGSILILGCLEDTFNIAGQLSHCRPALGFFQEGDYNGDNFHQELHHAHNQGKSANSFFSVVVSIPN